MPAYLRFVAGGLLSVAIFSFLVMQVLSEETSDTAALTDAASSTEIIKTVETAGTATTTEAVQATDTATSTEVIETTATIETASTTEAVETQPLTNEETTFATSTPAQESQVLFINPEVATASSSLAELDGSLSTSTPQVTNATSTEPVRPPYIEREFILQPSVDLKVDGDTVGAQIQLHNLSCRTCERQLKDTDVIAYYTTWYPNDGEIKEVGPRRGETSFSVSGLANWGEYETSWSAKVPPGHYYFVVTTDPDNLNNLYDMYRAEFEIFP